MNKRDFIWIGIRLLGVFFIVQAVLAIPNVFGAVMGAMAAIGDKHLPNFRDMAGAGIPLVVQGLVGLYCVMGGRGLVDMLARWPTSGAPTVGGPR